MANLMCSRFRETWLFQHAKDLRANTELLNLLRFIFHVCQFSGSDLSFLLLLEVSRSKFRGTAPLL